MRLERAGSIGLHVGPLRFSSKIYKKVDEKHDIFQDVFFLRLFLTTSDQRAYVSSMEQPPGRNYMKKGSK